MMENSTEISRLVNAAGEHAAGSVARTLGELRDTAQQAIAELKETTTAAVSEMMETHNMLRSDATALFSRLREANLLLQEVLSSSHESMSALENTLMTRVSDFVSSMQDVTASTGAATDRVEANIGNFRAVTGQVLSDLGQIAHQFDAHGRTLAQAADLVERSNQRAEANVGERRAQLEELVGTLDQRSDDLAQRLKRFSELLDDSLEAAAGRARDVARVVSELSSEGVRAISEQVDNARQQAEEIARLVATSSAEGSRALSDHYRQVREQTEEVVRIVAQTGADSARTIADEYERVREQTEEVMRAVSQTGTESARTIAEQYGRVREEAEAERRRTAGAMRDIFEQSIGDTQTLFAGRQRALRRDPARHEADGARNAARIGRDARRTAPRRVRSAAGDRRERRADAPRHRRPDRGAGRTQPHRRPPWPQSRCGRAGAARARGARVGRRRPRAASRRRGSKPFRAPSRSRVRRRVRAMRPPPSPLPRAARLPSPRRSRRPCRRLPAAAGSPTCSIAPRATRASRRATIRARADATRARESSVRTGDERTARHSIESLDSLSVDIARMIDHDAAVDLWDRYKRGERNVFTRRLYTLQGQQAFDEIRRKYRTDREFKQTVDRYIGEFERLLEEVSRDDRGQVVARTYLTSETGKVYTMLAHAAGRFD